MNFIDIFGDERVSYRNSLSLKKLFERNSDKLFINHEYVVVWYKKISNKYNSEKKQVEILLVNISTKQPSNFQIYINVSINYLHKIKIGSIWVNGSSKEYFKNEIFDISITSENYEINSFIKMTLDNKNNDYPFLVTEYPIKELPYDRNKLIKISWNRKSIIIHPLIFFIVHFGYSMEIKRVLLTYLWGYSNIDEDTVQNLLNLSDYNNISEDVIALPNKCTVRDAVFLYHLRHDSYTRMIVKNIINDARKFFVKSDSNSDYGFYPTIRPWHTQQIDLRISGIYLNDSTILCTGITAISEPTGCDITLLMPPVYKKKIEDVEVEKNSQKIAIRFRRKQELEKVEVDDGKKINNLHIATIKEKLGILGNARTINKNYEIKESGVIKKFKLINSDEPNDYSVGAGEGVNGKTGLADCFYNTSNATGDTYANDERLQKLWEHAQNLKKNKKAEVHWFTFNNGFNDGSNFKTMSMSSCHLDDTTSYPNEVLIIRVIMNENVYIVIDFALEKNMSTDKEIPQQGVVIKLQEKIESFLNVYNDTGLSSILIHIAIMNGIIAFDYLDIFKGKMVAFRHRDGQKNNWILNAIERIS